MSFLLACSLCAALLTVDLLARTLRLRTLFRGAGYRLPSSPLLVAIAFGDAAAAVTPMRLGGEPARWLGLRSAGISARVAASLLAVEMVAYLSVVAVSGAVAAWLLGAGWWAGVGPRLAGRAGKGLPWVIAVVVASAIVWMWARRRLVARPAATASAPALDAVRGALGRPVLFTIPLTLASIGARLAMLPVLAQTMPDPPPLGVLILGSFALVYGQLFFPTPGGAGAVELLISAGTAGELGGSVGPVFLAWRAVTTGLPVLLGFGLAIHRFGAPAVRAALRGDRAPDLPRPGSVELA